MSELPPVSRKSATVEELLRLLPAVDDLELFRLRLIGSAVPDPGKAWDSASAFATIDKRILSPEEVERALAAAEEALRVYVHSLYDGLVPVFRSHFAGRADETARHLVALGEAHEINGRLADARQCYRSALEVALPLRDKAPQILALRRIARVSLTLGEFREAALHYERSAQLARDSADAHGEVVARTGRGNVFLFQGRWPEAEQAYLDALKLLPDREEDTLTLERAQLYNNLGNVTTRLGRSEEAEEWLTLALELWSTIQSPVDLAICHINQAHLRESQARYNEARAAYEAALKQPASPAVRAIVASDYAQLCLAQGHVGQAESWARVAEEQAIAAGSAYTLGRMYQGRGNITRERGDEDGFTFYEKALQIAREKGFRSLEAETLTDYAEFRLRAGGAEEAQAYLERAREIFLESGSVHELERAERLLQGARSHLPSPTPGD